MPIQLYALTWSQEDTAAINSWQEENTDKVFISGWSRILLEPLDKAVSDPNIFGLSIDGVVISDHTRFSPDQIKEAVKKLSKGMLKLYAVSNGTEVITVPEPTAY